MSATNGARSNGSSDPTDARALGELRAALNRIIAILTELDRKEDALGCAELGVELSLWHRPEQRPLQLVDLPGRPVHDPSQFWFVPYLEQHFGELRAELDTVLAGSDAPFHPVDEPILGRGRWDQVVLFEAGERNHRACEHFPLLTEVVEAIPEATTNGPGVVSLSWLHPGSHIVPHCGRSNAHLRVHFGLRCPAGATMRVGSETVRWREGRCLVFDDSFEHEVHHLGDEPRIVLLFDVLHPDLPPPIQRQLLGQRLGYSDKIRDHMQANDYRRVELEDGRIRIEPTGLLDTLARRYLEAVDARAITLVGNRLDLER